MTVRGGESLDRMVGVRIDGINDGNGGQRRE